MVLSLILSLVACAEDKSCEAGFILGADGNCYATGGDTSDTDTDTDADTTAPTITLVSPLDGATLNGTASLSATASDDVGVAAVSFKIDGLELSSDDNEPYEASWDTTSLLNGNYVLSALAIDAAGNAAEVSAGVYVENDDGAPASSINMINPVDGSTICGDVNVEAAVSLSGATVVFSLDGTDLATDSTEPYTWAWNTQSTSNGTHYVRATATASDGLAAQSTITVDVENSGESCDNLPSVSFTAPDAASFHNSSVELTADASDDVGVLKVQFFMDNGLLTEDSSIPYGTAWNSDEFDEGPHTLKAIAYDTAAQTAETQITVTVDRTAPVVGFSAPVDGDVVQGTISLDLFAEDSGGLASVDVAMDGTSLGILTSPPWVIGWDTSMARYGAHTLTVRGTDHVGYEDTETISVFVDQPPSVSLDSPADGATVSGTSTVQATAEDDSDVVSVAFSVDGVIVSTDASVPFSWDWDTCGDTLGAHVLSVEVTDDAGNTSSDAVDVTITQVDGDGDGYDAGCEDCDDGDAAVHPGAAEVCADGSDNDCDGSAGTCSYLGEVDLSASSSMTLEGVTASDYAGTTIAAADVTGDSLDDILVGAPAEDSGGSAAGMLYVVSGASRGTSSLSAALAAITGEDAGDGFAASLWAADIDDDGYSDVLAGATGEDAGGSNSGAAYLFLGRLSSDIDASTFDGKFTGEAAGDGAGAAVCAGDIDGDGEFDAMVGAPYDDDGGSAAGAVYVSLGVPRGTIALSGADAKIIGETASDGAGADLVIADVDGDGLADVLTAAVGQDSGGSGAGAVYLLYGPLSGTIDLSAADTKFVGEAAGDSAGAVAAGDLDNDGLVDVIVGATGVDDGGAVYVVSTPAIGSIDLSSSDVKITGASTYGGEGLGSSVTTGDLDGDGVEDLLAGASSGEGLGCTYYSSDGYWECPGSAYVFLGALSGVASTGDADATLLGDDGGTGAAVASGDLNGDGIDDALMSAPYADNAASSAGQVFGVLGASRW